MNKYDELLKKRLKQLRSDAKKAKKNSYEKNEFYNSANKNPLFMDKHLDALFKKYGIESYGPDKNTLFWFENNDIKTSKKGNKKLCFDQRECWNLDYALSLILYPRLKEFKDNALGTPGSFKNQKEYNKKVLNPIIKGLEIHIVAFSYDVYYDFFDGEQDGLSGKEYAEFEDYCQKQVANSYKLLGENIFCLWM